MKLYRIELHRIKREIKMHRHQRKLNVKKGTCIQAGKIKKSV